MSLEIIVNAKQCFSDLHELHEEWLIKKNKFTPIAPVYVIEVNGNLSQLSSQYETFEKEIIKRHG